MKILVSSELTFLFKRLHKTLTEFLLKLGKLVLKFMLEKVHKAKQESQEPEKLRAGRGLTTPSSVLHGDGILQPVAVIANRQTD